jgi:regulator of protease activity HflC (stomatin/prohibitin superfamily)
MNQHVNSKSVLVIGLAGLVLMTLMGSWYTVDETERGVLLRNGALVKVVEPGLSFKIPFIETVKFISVQSNATTYQGLQAYSKDQQTATLNVSVSWHVLPSEVDKVYMQYQDLNGLITRLISRQVPTQVENVFGQYNAVSSVQNRGKFVNDVTKAIKEAIAGPVVIDGVQIENIDFSDDYERSIALRMKAEVEVKTREQMLATEQVEAQIVVTRAQADADSRVAQAKADAEATRLRGDAEADAIRAKTLALSSNPALIELTKAERWDGKLPTTMLPNGALPFIEVAKP